MDIEIVKRAEYHSLIIKAIAAISNKGFFVLEGKFGKQRCDEKEHALGIEFRSISAKEYKVRGFMRDGLKSLLSCLEKKRRRDPFHCQWMMMTFL